MTDDVRKLFDEDALQRFLHFIRERHHIYENRAAGVSYVTDDDVLRTYRFCNVFRFLDRGSQWIIEQLNDPEYGLQLSKVETIMFCTLYRRTNNAEAWQTIKDEYHLPRWDEFVSGEYLNHMMEINQRVHFCNNRVYNVGNNAIKGIPLLEGTYQKILDSGQMIERSEISNRESVFEDLLSISGVHFFISQQITTDIGYSQYGSEEWENDGVSIGPGSRRGIERLLRVNPGARAIDSKFRTMDLILRNFVLSNEKNVVFRHGSIRRYPSLMDIQNCLCEFDKYERYSNREVRGGRRFSESVLRPLPELQIPISWRSSDMR